MPPQKNDAWTIELKTLSRDGAIKVSTMLADALDEKRLTTQRTRIFILGGAGKSLIMDAMAQHLSDNHSAYKMPPKRFIEGKPSNALKKNIGRHIVRKITHNSTGMAVTFRHLAGVHRKSWFENLRAKFDASRRIGLDFMTEINDGFNQSFIPDISIGFYLDTAGELEKGWGRHWTITIKNPALHTKVMRHTLDNLTLYNQRRQNRALPAQKQN